MQTFTYDFNCTNGDNSFYAVCYDRNILEYEKKGDYWEIKKTVTTDQGKKLPLLKGNVSS